MTQVTAKQSYIKDADGSYVVPFVNPADNTNLGVVKPDGTTITVNNGVLSTNNKNLLAIAAYASNGELLTDADGLSFIQKYAHSTFDLSKFTVVGSPTITKDGIASGFSSSSYLKCGKFDWTKPFEINFIYTPHYNSSNGQYLLSMNGIGADGLTNGLEFNFDNNNQTYTMAWNVVGTYGGVTGLVVSNISFSTSLRVKLSYDGTTYFMSYKGLNDESWTIKQYTSQDTIPTTEDLVIGYGLYRAWQGSIDLKQFSITVDGVEVFSGNKTGIDTIKPDDYTVVGTPTISADGIASGFSTSDYLTKSSAFTIGSDGKFNIDFKSNWTQSSSIQYIFDAYINNQNEIIIRRNANGGVINLIVFSGGTALLNQAITPANPNNIVGFFGYNGTHYYWVINGTTYGGGTQTKPAAGTYNLSLGIRSAAGTNMDALTTGNLDLNAFKVTDGNGDLVYQPCLKIPYTLSKTGAKIVDSIYRDRVTDMAEQFGFANYYTLSDTDFTLPQVELYGLIGQRTLRDSYRNGINYWELYSNRDLEQGGSCTSGVEVTFARPFADTNYVLSVPYSAKSATAFTPTQTGDWIAKGKGIL